MGGGQQKLEGYIESMYTDTKNHLSFSEGDMLYRGKMSPPPHTHKKRKRKSGTLLKCILSPPHSIFGPDIWPTQYICIDEIKGLVFINTVQGEG